MWSTISGPFRCTIRSRAARRRASPPRRSAMACPASASMAMTILAVYAADHMGGRAWRKGGGPTLIEHFTYRGEAHSTSDDPRRYRPKDEYEAWPLGDPVERLRAHLIGWANGTPTARQMAEADCRERVSVAWKEAVSHGTLEEGPHAPTRPCSRTSSPPSPGICAASARNSGSSFPPDWPLPERIRSSTRRMTGQPHSLRQGTSAQQDETAMPART